MTLQNKTLLIVSICIIATIWAIYLISQTIVMESFQELENNYVRDSSQRVEEIIENEFEYLSTLANIFAYSAGGMEQGVNNLHQSMIEKISRIAGNTDLNLVAIFPVNNSTPVGYYSVSGNPSDNILPSSWQQVMSPEHPLYIPRSPDGRSNGLVVTAEGQALMVASSRIVNENKQDQVQGTIIIGRLIDTAEIQKLSRMAKLSLRIINVNNIAQDNQLFGIYRSLTVNAPYRVQVQDNLMINGLTLLRDVKDRPAFVVEISLPRDIYQQGQAAQQYFTKLLVIVGITTMTIVLIMINYLVLSRLNRFRKGIVEIQTTGDLTSQVNLGGNDELTVITNIFNRLLNGLHHSQQELENQINERIEAENAIQESQKRYQRAELIGKIGNWEWNEIDNCIDYCSEQFALIYGTSVDVILKEFINRDAELKTVHSDDRDRVAGSLADARNNKTKLDIEYRIYTKQKNIRHVHRISEPFINNHGVLVSTQGTLQDITRQKLVQEKLEMYQNKMRVLMSELALAEEKQRRSIADGLHDSTIQNLGLSKFKLSIFLNSLPEGISPTLLNEVIETLDNAIRETRTLVFELSPPILYELGFVPAIEWLAEQVHLQRGLICEVHDDNKEKPLKTSMMISLFQIIRELLINISKHAQATKASVEIRRIGKKINIKVEDDGVGLDIEQIDGPVDELKGYGLFSIRERLNNLGEEMQIISSPGEGAQIIFSVLLNIQEESDD